MPTKEKINQVEILKEKFARARAVIIADHTGIDVNSLTILRRDLKKSGSEFRVAKNTLLRLAARDSGLEQLDRHLSGPTSMVYGFDDPSMPARIIYESIKNTEKPRVKAFILEHQILTGQEFEKMAKLPPRNEVLSQLVGSVQGPIANFIMTADGVIRNFIGLLDALADKMKN